jgi:hypothetical protein
MPSDSVDWFKIICSVYVNSASAATPSVYRLSMCHDGSAISEVDSFGRL